MVVLVTGGRSYGERDFVWWVLGRVHARRRITKLVEGGATGADAHARSWAIAHGIDPTTCDAEWTRYGHRAGAQRNSFMLRAHRPQLVIGFPGGTGTADMMMKARGAGVKTLPAWRYEEEYSGLQRQYDL